MRLGQCTVTNFGSYSSLSFDFNNIGLSLVHGSTGSGKSTLLDIPCWILYGVTAKNGSVDEVRSWKAGDSPTAGTIAVKTQTGTIEVTRVRGKKSDNDLYYIENGEKVRGKDLKDTQAKLEHRLGVTSDLYLAASYFSEFSPISSFFIQTAKNRRQILDLIADTQLADSLMMAISNDKKTKKASGIELEKKVLLLNKDHDNLTKQVDDLIEYSSNWTKQQEDKVLKYTVERDSFEKIKQSKVDAALTAIDIWKQKQAKKIDTLNHKIKVATSDVEQCESNTCPTCGKGSSGNEQKLIDNLSDLLDEVKSLKKEEPSTRELDSAKGLQNNYQTLLDQVKTEKNPYLINLQKRKSESVLNVQDLDITTKKFEEYKERTFLLDDLNDITSTLRGELIKRAIQDIQNQTNNYLERFFDSEIRISLTVPDSDSIEVEIKKNGYECVYSQLSKGQRGLLKLCFCLSVMKAAANKAGIHFEGVFLDEALDGLDPELKVKAFNLLAELSIKHSTIIVIDHSMEFKSCFPRKYHVALSNDESTIDES